MPTDFTRTLKTFDGEEMTDGPKLAPLTLSRLACNALLSGIAQETVTGDQHLTRFLLAEKIKDNAAAELSAEEIALIKERIVKAYNVPLVVGQGLVMLDPDGAAAALKKVA